MAFLLALVLTTWEEPLTRVVACWYLFRAGGPLATKKVLDSLMTTWTEEYSRWGLLAWLAVTSVTDLVTLVLATVQD